MNLAVGGWFDGGVVPDSSFTSAEMLVDYVRVYKEEGTWEPETIAITGLGLDKASVRLNVGQTTNLNKVYTPSNTTQRNVEWTSSNEAVATVSAGQVTAVGEGTALITASSTANSSLSASCVVTVTKGAEEVTVDPVDPGTEDPVDPVEPGKDDPVDPVEPVEDTFVPTAESGVHQNSDGTITFYVKAEDTAFGPMVYYGANLDDPALYKMAGAFLKKDASYGENYFTYTTGAAYAASDVISYLFSYTPLGGSGRIDSAITSQKLSDAKANESTQTGGNETQTGNDQKQDDSNENQNQGGNESDNTGSTGNTGTVQVNDELGAFQNNDGTITFYVKAEDTSFAPMLYWGVNKTNPQLWQLAGLALTKDASLGDNYFSFTTTESYAASDVMNYMFSYTPLNAGGRIDSEIFSTKVSAMTAPVAEVVEEVEGEYGVKRNADGTLTFYIYANENEATPLVFWGFDKTNPQLWQLAGAAMNRTGDKEGYYTFTVKAEGSTVSYMFGYTPLNESGRRDTAIVTEAVK
ncbi:MAG: Ig-like domain-containing protein [Lachnospiraceae bacterium]|nr:Ig-like domain-containing protein [Lachnospiraceae bacterium]